jgi:hypothetical protein
MYIKTFGQCLMYTVQSGRRPPPPPQLTESSPLLNPVRHRGSSSFVAGKI